MRTIDLNCDLGEGFPNDAGLIALVSSVNVACGGHAGDEGTIRNAVRMAAAAGVNIGAHPGYEDREHFGRMEVALAASAVRELMRGQMDRLQAIVRSERALLCHVKPHGALYHAAARDEAIAEAVLEGVEDSSLAIVGPPAGRLRDAAVRAGRRYVPEGFIDRRYQVDGTLVPRGRADAVLADPTEAAMQAVSLAVDRKVATTGGDSINLNIETLCAHGDGAAAREFLYQARAALEHAGLSVRPVSL